MTLIDLEAKTTIASVRELKERLSSVLEDGSEEDLVRLDASRVTHIDTAGIQAIVGFINSLNANGRTLVWQGANDAVVDAATSLDLCQYMSFERIADYTEVENDENLCPVF